MMGNLIEPFATERRFRVDFVVKPPSYTLWLHIAGSSALPLLMRWLQPRFDFDFTDVRLLTKGR